MSDPTHLQLTGHYNTDGSNYYRVTVSGKYAYVADKEFGLQVIDISEPANPNLVGWYGLYPSSKYGLTCMAYDVTYSSGFIYLAQWPVGFRIFSNDLLNGTPIEQTNHIPDRFALNQNYPNPFNPLTTIHYSLPARLHVDLKIYNVLGQLVATLVNKDQAAGSYSVQFDAHNLPSGMYIYRLKAGNYTSVKKMMVIE